MSKLWKTILAVAMSEHVRTVILKGMTSPRAYDHGAPGSR